MKTYRVPVPYDPSRTSSIMAAYVTLPAPPWPVEDEQPVSIEELRQRNLAGESASSLAREYGVHNQVILRILRRGQQWKS